MEQSLTTQSEENNEVKDKYLKWFVMHKDEREAANLPMNPEEYQKRYGVTHEEIKAIHLSESFIDDIYKYTQRWAKLKVTEMAHILVDNYLKSKSPRDFETYLKFLDIDKGKQTDIGNLKLITESGKEFSCGSGFDDATRLQLWGERDTLVGRLAKVKYFEQGNYDVPLS